MNLQLILLVFAFVLFVLAAIGVPKESRYHLGWAGLACWVATLLFR